jgi:hypothetical protein
VTQKLKKLHKLDKLCHKTPVKASSFAPNGGELNPKGLKKIDIFFEFVLLFYPENAIIQAGLC